MDFRKSQLMINSLLFRWSYSGQQKNPYPDNRDLKNLNPGEILSRQKITNNGNKIIKIDFGIIMVPENRNKKNPKYILLPIMKWNALTNNPSKPIFWLGSILSSTSTLTLSGELELLLSNLKWMLYHHDIVMVGYRGINVLNSSGCNKLNKIFEIENNPVSFSDLHTVEKTFNSAFKKLREKEVDLDGYNIVEVADDLESVRRAFGYQKINLLSVNFGNSVCLIYSLKYSEHLNQTLISEADSHENLLASPEIFYSQLKYYHKLR